MKLMLDRISYPSGHCRVVARFPGKKVCAFISGMPYSRAKKIKFW